MKTDSRFSLIKIIVSLCLMAMFAAGCAERSMAPPPANTFTPIPKTVEVVKLRDAYAVSTSQADAMYVGQRVHLKDLTVSSVWRGFVAYYAIVDNMWFKVAYPFYLDGVGPDTVIEVTGICSGYMYGRIYFEDCWVGVISGATATRSGY
jgi:hypothetical protein